MKNAEYTNSSPITETNKRRSRRCHFWRPSSLNHNPPGCLKNEENFSKGKLSIQSKLIISNFQSHIRKRLPSGNQGALDSSFSNYFI